jgi:hypothetical protein
MDGEAPTTSLKFISIEASTEKSSKNEVDRLRIERAKILARFDLLHDCTNEEGLLRSPRLLRGEPVDYGDDRGRDLIGVGVCEQKYGDVVDRKSPPWKKTAMGVSYQGSRWRRG